MSKDNAVPSEARLMHVKTCRLAGIFPQINFDIYSEIHQKVESEGEFRPFKVYLTVTTRTKDI